MSASWGGFKAKSPGLAIGACEYKPRLFRLGTGLTDEERFSCDARDPKMFRETPVSVTGTDGDHGGPRSMGPRGVTLDATPLAAHGDMTAVRDENPGASGRAREGWINR